MRMSRSLTILGSVLIITMGAMWIANAAVPSADGTFTACINKSSGAVRIIDAEKTPPVNCASNEIRRSWNQQGVPGKDGTDGLLGTYTTEERSNQFGSVIDFVHCDEGDVPISGNFLYGAREDGVALDTVGSTRLEDANGPYWAFYAISDTPGVGVAGTWSVNCLDTAAPAHTP